MESSIAFRTKYAPRIIAIRTSSQLQARIDDMNSIELWITMSQKRIAGWKHKIMSDELEKRKYNLLESSAFYSFIR